MKTTRGTRTTHPARRGACERPCDAAHGAGSAVLSPEKHPGRPGYGFFLLGVAFLASSISPLFSRARLLNSSTGIPDSSRNFLSGPGIGRPVALRAVRFPGEGGGGDSCGSRSDMRISLSLSAGVSELPTPNHDATRVPAAAVLFVKNPDFFPPKPRICVLCCLADSWSVWGKTRNRRNYFRNWKPALKGMAA